MIIVFYASLYIIGLIFALHFSKNVPVWFLVTTSFLWGKLIWIFCSLILLVFGFTYSLPTITLLLSILVIIGVANLIQKKLYPVETNQYLIMVLGFLGVLILSYVLTQKSYVFASTDSFNLILVGRVLGQSGFQDWSIYKFTAVGLLTPVFLMSSTLFPGDFISGYQTILAVSLFVMFSVSIFIELLNHTNWVTAVFGTLALNLSVLTITFIEHAFYIHTNLTAAVFMYTAIYSFWNHLRNGSSEWLYLGCLALLAFSFTRIEGPLYAIPVIAILISIKQFKRKQLIPVISGYTLPVIAWYGYLLFSIDQYRLLTPQNILIIISLTIGLILFSIVSTVFPKPDFYPRAILGVLFLGLILTFILKPDHMVISSLNVFRNLSEINNWGISWLLSALFLPLFLKLNTQTRENQWVAFCIISYFIIVFALGFPRVPYRLGRTDSANRLLLSLQPVFFFYIAANSGRIKAYLALNDQTAEE